MIGADTTWEANESERVWDTSSQGTRGCSEDTGNYAPFPIREGSDGRESIRRNIIPKSNRTRRIVIQVSKKQTNTRTNESYKNVIYLISSKNPIQNSRPSIYCVSKIVTTGEKKKVASFKRSVEKEKGKTIQHRWDTHLWLAQARKMPKHQ